MGSQNSIVPAGQKEVKVSGPDGKVYSFPAGTPADVMHRAMAARFPASQRGSTLGGFQAKAGLPQTVYQKPTLGEIGESLSKPIIPAERMLRSTMPNERMAGVTPITVPGMGTVGIPQEESAGAALGLSKVIEDFSRPPTVGLGVGAGILGSMGLPGMVVTGGLSLDMLRNAWKRFQEGRRAPEGVNPRERVASGVSAGLEALAALAPWLREGRSPRPVNVEKPASISKQPPVVEAAPAVESLAPAPAGPAAVIPAPAPAPAPAPEIPAWMKSRMEADALRAAEYEAAQARKIPPPWPDIPDTPAPPTIPQPSQTPVNPLLALTGSTEANQVGATRYVPPKPSNTGLPPAAPVQVEAKLTPRKRAKGREETLAGAIKSMGGITIPMSKTETLVTKTGKVKFQPKRGDTMYDLQALRESGITPQEFGRIITKKGGMLQDELSVRLAERGFDFKDDNEVWAALLDPRKRRQTARELFEDPTTTVDFKAEWEAAYEAMRRERDELASRLEQYERPSGYEREPGEEGFARYRDDRTPNMFGPVKLQAMPEKSKETKFTMQNLADELLSLQQEQRSQALQDVQNRVLSAPDARISKRTLLGLDQKKKSSAIPPLFDQPKKGLFR